MLWAQVIRVTPCVSLRHHTGISYIGLFIIYYKTRPPGRVEDGYTRRGVTYFLSCTRPRVSIGFTVHVVIHRFVEKTATRSHTTAPWRFVYDGPGGRDNLSDIGRLAYCKRVTARYGGGRPPANHQTRRPQKVKIRRKGLVSLYHMYICVRV